MTQHLLLIYAMESFILLHFYIGMDLRKWTFARMKYLRILHKVYKKIINLQLCNLIGFSCIEVILAGVKWPEIG